MQVGEGRWACWGWGADICCRVSAASDNWQVRVRANAQRPPPPTKKPGRMQLAAVTADCAYRSNK